MGEIADDMIDGTSCSLCGCYFVDPKNNNKTYTHGYPVVCFDCYDDLRDDEKIQYQKAEVKTK
jgi:hypothetical protein